MSYVLCNRTSSTSQGNNSLHFQRADGRRRHTDGCQDTTGRVTAHDNSVTATQTFCHFSGNHIITSWSLNSPFASLWIQLKYAHPFGDYFKIEFVLLDLNFFSFTKLLNLLWTVVREMNHKLWITPCACSAKCSNFVEFWNGKQLSLYSLLKMQ